MTNTWSEEFWLASRGERWKGRLALMPEPNLLAYLDDWESDDGCQVKFYLRCVERYGGDYWKQGWVGILWIVMMSGNGAWMPPFHAPGDESIDMTWFTQDWKLPVSVKTGEPVDWYRLPIQHRFPAFWKALGWNPGPFQSRFDVANVAASHRCGKHC